MRVVSPGILVLVALAVLTACSRLAPTDTAVDPAQRGTYAVGLTRQVFSRTLPDGQTRNVETYIWYPAPDQGGEWAGTAGVRYGVGRPVAPGQPFPLIVFSHGYQASPTVYSQLIFRLVSHGFVVAGPEHQDCRAQCTAQNRATEVENRPADVSAVLDGLLALNDGDDPLFRSLLDPARVGLAGQSFGGWTALIVLERDSRFRAGLALAPATAILPAPDPVTLSPPVMLMAGVLDAMVPYALITRYFGDILPAAPDHYLLAVQQAGHQFADGCLAGFVTTGCAASMPQAELQGLVNRVATAYVLRYVAGRRLPDEQLGLHDSSADYVVVRATADRPPVAPTPRPHGGADSAASDAPGTVLLADDLSGPRGDHLPTRSSEPGRYDVGYVDGAYQIAVNRPATQSASSQGEAVVSGIYVDASIAVDAELLNATPDQFVQLACRSQGPTSQYRFGFRPATGEYWLTRWLLIPGYGVLSPPMLPGDCSRRPSTRAARAIAPS